MNLEGIMFLVKGIFKENEILKSTCRRVQFLSGFLPMSCPPKRPPWQEVDSDTDGGQSLFFKK